MKPSLLLVDDNSKLLDELEGALRALLPEDEVEIRKWQPTKDNINARDTFDALVDPGTILIITDYDLTTQGQTGLFGSSIVGWAQSRGIAVGDFSRGNPGNLPKEPNFFELRVPTQADLAPPFIANVYRGFLEIRNGIEARAELLTTLRSPAAVLAALLERPAIESQFALYGVRLGATNGALVEKIMQTAPNDVEPAAEEKRLLLGYIVGHLLFNAVLKFPGPILSAEALCAYTGVDRSAFEKIAVQFHGARYLGPFSHLNPFFWRAEVDDRLDELSKGLEQGVMAATQGELNRTILEKALSETLARGNCSRCNGINGGFLCPFTKRTVCQLPECSVGSSSWIPQGARLCRIERDFYEEWAPILGI